MSTSPTSSIQAQINDDLRQAMRDRDEVAKLALRSLKAALTESSKAGSEHELDEQTILSVVQREVKRRRDAAEEYDELGRSDRAAQERAEMTVLQRYLPPQLDESEVETIVRQVMEEIGASDLRDMGRMMSAVMSRVAGSADGKTVNQIVRRLLSG